jgi:deoxyribonuclease-1
VVLLGCATEQPASRLDSVARRQSDNGQRAEPPRAEPPRAEPSSVLPPPRVPSSFRRAKELATLIHADHRATFYCGCEYTASKRVLARGCGYVPRTRSLRGQRIEWEHIVPAYAFGAHRRCWTQKLCRDGKGRAYKGRECCREADREFRRMEADLQNLTPEIGELNAARSHFAFGEVVGEPRRYGACDFEVDNASRTAEPAEQLRGDIARAYLYMHATYGAQALPLPARDLERFKTWHQKDPPTPWEDQRQLRIQEIQNPRPAVKHSKTDLRIVPSETGH